MAKVTNEMDEILNKLNSLKEAKPHILSRQETLKQLLSELEFQKKESDLEEEKEILETTIDRTKTYISLINDFLSELSSEDERVTEAIKAIESKNIVLVKSAFTKFILSDVALSAKNIYMMFYDTDEVIETIKRICAQGRNGNDLNMNNS